MSNSSDETGTQSPESVVPVIEIGGTHLAAARIAGEDLKVVEYTTRPTWLDAQAKAPVLLEAFAAALVGANIGDSPIGIAIPGPFDYERGVGAFAGVDKFKSLDGVDVRAGIAALADIDPTRFRRAIPHLVGEQ